MKILLSEAFLGIVNSMFVWGGDRGGARGSLSGTSNMCYKLLSILFLSFSERNVIPIPKHSFERLMLSKPIICRLRVLPSGVRNVGVNVNWSSYWCVICGIGLLTRVQETTSTLCPLAVWKSRHNSILLPERR